MESVLRAIITRLQYLIYYYPRGRSGLSINLKSARSAPLSLSEELTSTVFGFRKFILS